MRITSMAGVAAAGLVAAAVVLAGGVASAGEPGPGGGPETLSKIVIGEGQTVPASTELYDCPFESEAAL